MNYPIHSFPNIELRNYFGPPLANDPILSRRNFFYYASGRAALYFALKTTKLPFGSKVLVPSFHCGVEVEAVLRAGYEVEYFKVDTDLTIDFDALSLRVTKQTRVLVVIHYFGFPQDMTKVMQFCVDNNLFLIEDCAHALYSAYQGKWLGSFGAFGVYSLQKTIGLPNGGGLLCNSPRFPSPPLGKEYFNLSLLKVTIRSILEYKAKNKSLAGLVSREILNLYKNLSKNKKDISVTIEEDGTHYYELPTHYYDHSISSLSKPLLKKDPYDGIIKTRRRNYIRMIKHLEDIPGVAIVYNQINEGVCPLCCVVALENRDRVADEMSMMGVDPFVFGKFLHKSLSLSAYPDARYLSDHLLGLPIHHQLSEKDTELVVETLKKTVKKNRR